MRALSARAWPIRIVRALAVAGPSASLALGGHMLGGGQLPPPPIVLLLWFMVGAVAWRISRREMDACQIAGVMMLAQAAVHLSCSMGSGSGMGASGSALGMLAGHGASVVAATVLVRRGEAMVWSALDHLAIALFGTPVASLSPARGVDSLRASRSDQVALSSVNHCGAAGVRGPPVGSVSLA